MTISVTQDFGHTISRTVLYGGKIVVYRSRSNKRTAVDTWAEMVIQDSVNWPLDKPMLVLHDVREMGMTPYSTKRTMDVARSVPRQLQGRYAVLLSSGPIGMTVRLFVQGQARKAIPNLDNEIFLDYDQAVAWLEEGISAAYRPLSAIG
jgi:hypothetical protein